MNKRLEAIRRLIPDGRGMIDVGTDHGYLPVQLYKDGYPGRIFASDIRPGPLAVARERADREGASERISFFLCDGLDACPPEEIDTIVANLQEYAAAIRARDAETLERILREGRIAKEKSEKA